MYIPLEIIDRIFLNLMVGRKKYIYCVTRQKLKSFFHELRPKNVFVKNYQDFGVSNTTAFLPGVDLINIRKAVTRKKIANPAKSQTKQTNCYSS